MYRRIALSEKCKKKKKIPNADPQHLYCTKQDCANLCLFCDAGSHMLINVYGYVHIPMYSYVHMFIFRPVFKRLNHMVTDSQVKTGFNSRL